MASSSTLSSWDAYDAKHLNTHDQGGLMNKYPNNNTNNSSYSNIYNKSDDMSKRVNNNYKNAFCTANELGRKVDDNHAANNECDGGRYNNSNNNNINSNKNTFEYNHNQQYQQPPNPYQNQHYEEEDYLQQQQQQQQHNPNRPTLSAGLKRKFQTPKLGLGNTAKGGIGGGNSRNTSGNTNTTTNSNRINNNNNNNNSISNPKMSNGNKAAYNANGNNNNNNDDDDLPEELKGLDKELISKIENEIVDSGDPITFADIAGLEDAKQTVLELVCWPMKRPDLFTGLRRGPNGLLLFGPPGMYMMQIQLSIPTRESLLFSLTLLSPYHYFINHIYNRYR